MTPQQATNVELILGEVRHIRHLPKHHGFKVPAFSIRLRLNGVEQIADSKWFGVEKKAVFSIRWSDYGTKPHARSSTEIKQQLLKLLAQSSIHNADGEIFLHTFPRMFGYVFNPVSFWFFHTTGGGLRAIICEVNNTFGERHFYVLSDENKQGVSNGQLLTANKEFYVSPFFKVQGHYSFRFMNTANRSIGRIDFHAPEGHCLSTSISGERFEATDALWKTTLWRYRWFTLGVILKIHWQALKLILKGIRPSSKPPAPNHIATRSHSL
jgi:hypothetical protein